jgi:hypothetical protein
MGLVRRLALIVLLISLLTFIALFGALPRLRYELLFVLLLAML